MKPRMRVRDKKEAIRKSLGCTDPRILLDIQEEYDHVLTRAALYEMFIEDYMLEERFKDWAIQKQKQDSLEVIHGNHEER